MKLKPGDPLPDVPESDPVARGAEDFFPWQKFIQEINHLLVDGGYEYARGTLEGIADTLLSTHHVTQGQRDAINNISFQPGPRLDREEEYGSPRRRMRRRWERE